MNESTGKQTCDVCGHIIAKPVGYTANCFRLHVNEINNFDQFIETKKYIVHFIESRYNKVLSRKFLETFEKMLEDHNRSHDIEYIRLWLLEIINTTRSTREMRLYKFLRDEYSDINEPFSEFYSKYTRNVGNPLTKNLVSRSLTALGLKTVVVREKRDGKWTTSVVIRASENELTEMFRKNGI